MTDEYLYDIGSYESIKCFLQIFSSSAPIYHIRHTEAFVGRCEIGKCCFLIIIASDRD